jgi:hypothetical protein
MSASPKDIELLLSFARSRIANNNPNDALASIIQAIRLTTGEDSIMEILDQVWHN